MPIFGFGRPKLSASSTVGITEEGKREAEKFTSHGPMFAILAALAERSPQSIGQLSTRTGLTVGEVKKRLQILARQGYVRFTGLEA